MLITPEVRIKLHKNHPQRIPNMHDRLTTGHADTFLHNMLVVKTFSLILYTFLLVVVYTMYINLHFDRYNMHVSSVYNFLFADSEQLDTLQSRCLSCPAPSACTGASMPPPKTTHALVQLPQLWPSLPL